MAILGFELEEIGRLIAMLQSHELNELVIEGDGRYLRIRRGSPPAVTAPATGEARYGLPAIAPYPHSAPNQIEAAPMEAAAEGQIALTSPMVGIFYRAEKPGATPFVEVGQHVVTGQTIGIIEAMKSFSEVPAEHSGTVTAIPAQEGELVQAGAPLVILAADSATE